MTLDEVWLCDPSSTCITYGLLSVFKLSLSLFLYHAILAILTVGATDSRHPRGGLHVSKWPVKMLLVIALFFACWFIPNTFFGAFSTISLSGAAAFSLAQVALLFEFADLFVAPYQQRISDDGDRAAFALLLLASFLFFSLCAAMISLIFVMYGGCARNLAFAGVTVGLVVMLIVISLSPRVQQGRPQLGLFHAALIGAFVSFLMWSAIIAAPQDDGSEIACDFPIWETQNAMEIAVRVVSGGFLLIALWNIAFSQGDSSEEATPLVMSASDIDTTGSSRSASSPSQGEEPYSFTKFHQLMASGALYLGMISSDWNLLTVWWEGEDGRELIAPDQGEATMWVKMALSWVGFLIFIAVAIAPLVRNRD